MKKRILSIFLAVCFIVVLLPNFAFAATTFSDMPNDYSTTALEAAVANGLINGSDGKILPGDNLTRAQMAAIISRAFGATEQASLATYSDVPASEWYFADLGKAVQMKVFNGDNGLMKPNDPITRQEVFAVLARALKLEDGTMADLEAFTDKADVSNWAVGSTAAMVSNGYVNGANSELNPNTNISRKDFAVLMDNIIKTYINTAGVVTELKDGSVMINVPNVTLQNVTVKGNLIIGDGVGDGNVTLDNVKVEGSTIVRGGGVNSFIVKGNSSLGTITVAKVDGNVRISVEGNAEVEIIEIKDGKDDVLIEGNIEKLNIAASGVPVSIQHATINEVSVTAENADVTIANDSKVTTLTMAAANTALNVAGTVETLTAAKTAEGAKIEVSAGASVGTINTEAAKSEITGEGSVQNVNVTANDVKVDTSGTQLTVGAGVTGTTTNGENVEAGTTIKTEGQTPSTSNVGGGIPFINVTTSAELTTALTNAKDGDAILAAAGTYADDITIDKAVTLQGVGNTTVFTGGITVSSDNVSLKNFKMSYAGGESQKAGIAISDVSITSMNVIGVTVENYYYGMISTDTNQNVTFSGLTVENCIFQNNLAKGFYAVNLTDSTFRNSRFLNNATTEIVSGNPLVNRSGSGIDLNLMSSVANTTYQNIIIDGCTFTNNGMLNNTDGSLSTGGDIKVKARGGTSDPSYGTLPLVTVNGTVVKNCTFGIESPRNLVIGSSDVASTFVAVDTATGNTGLTKITDNSNTTTVTTSAQLATALTNATAGETIYAAAGTYADDITIDKAVTIQGVGDATLFTGGITVSSNNVSLKNFKMSYVGTLSLSNQKAGITISDVAITSMDVIGVTVENYYYGMISTDTNQNVKLSGLTVENCIFQNNLAKGFYAVNLTDSTFKNSQFLNNATTTIDSGNPLVDRSGSGIDLNLMSIVENTTYQSIVIDGCTFTNNGMLYKADGTTLATGGDIKVKARGGSNDPSYSTLPLVTVNGTVVKNCTFGDSSPRHIVIGTSGVTSTFVTVDTATGNTGLTKIVDNSK